MSKNLNRAASWIQKQIDELRAERDAAWAESAKLKERGEELDIQISELFQVLEKLPVEEKPLV
ncbi:MAG TPA: hypothetical protein VD884_13275 [Ohtaekwangia sp.]|nr:hypothetical protein [Ohtaekwangia sp.]